MVARVLERRDIFSSPQALRRANSLHPRGPSLHDQWPGSSQALKVSFAPWGEAVAVPRSALDLGLSATSATDDHFASP